MPVVQERIVEVPKVQYVEKIVEVRSGAVILKLCMMYVAHTFNESCISSTHHFSRDCGIYIYICIWSLDSFRSCSFM